MTRGQTILLEMGFVVMIVAGIAAIAIPKSAELRRREAARTVLSDVEVVRDAVYHFYSDSAYFPRELPTGLVPETLEPYLPPRFSLRRSWGTMEYRHWPIAARDSTTPASSVVGVSVTTTDPRVGAIAATRARTAARFTIGNTHTWIFFGA